MIQNPTPSELVDRSPISSLKVLYLSHKNPIRQDEGAKIVIMGTLRHIAAQGCRVSLVCLDADRCSDAPLKSICREVRMVPHRPPGKAKALATSLTSGTPYSVLLFDNEQFRQAISEIVSRETFDVVHMETALLYQYAACLRGLPLVLRHHNLEGELLNQQARSASNPFRKAILNWQANSLMKYERAALSSATLSVAITGVDRESILEKYGSSAPVHVIPSGVDAPATVPEPPTEHCVVFSGRMDWAPNAEAAAWFATRVFPQIRRVFPTVKFYIVGGNPDRSTRALAGNGVVVTGFVSSVDEYLDRAEVCVVPLLSGSGMRLKILQAMARGKAIVSTTKGAEGIMCTNLRDIVLADSPEELAASVVTLLGDPSQRRALGAAAIDTVRQEYSWNEVGSRFVKCYHAAMLPKLVSSGEAACK